MPYTSLTKPAVPPYLRNILDDSEPRSLNRVVTAVAHLYRVPVAFLALFDGAGAVVSRIGTGHQDGAILAGIRFQTVSSKQQTWRDTAREAPDFDWGGLGFVAMAPLNSVEGVGLGILTIAAQEARPEFSGEEEIAFGELARLISAKMELRSTAAHALQSHLDLYEIEGRFRAIANAAPVLMVCTGPHGNVTFVNRSWLEFTGRNLLQEIGDGWIESVHPEDRKRLRIEFRRALQERRHFTAEAQMLRRDGAYRWMLSQGAPRYREDGSFAGFVGCITDVTELRNGRLSGAA
jgi:PAS domain S-box-containing protein